MRLDSDAAVVGTGLAPLIAALVLKSFQKKVLIINPDSDFFLEDSELPLDPLLPPHLEKSFDFERITNASPEKVLEELRPLFPGAVNLWSSGSKTHAQDVIDHSRDQKTPWIRAHNRLWISSKSRDPFWPKEKLEEKYLLSLDSGLKTQLFDGYQAIKKFPGSNSNVEDYLGLMIPRLADVDVNRYRFGLLEYILEDKENFHVVNSVDHLEVIQGGVRFRHSGQVHTARILDGVLFYITPRMLSFMMDLFKNKLFRNITSEKNLPHSFLMWEEWNVISRDFLDPSVCGMYQDMTVWADCDGVPTFKENRMKILRLAEKNLYKKDQTYQNFSSDWVSGQSLKSLNDFFQDFMKWDRFSVRSMKPRYLLEWEPQSLSPTLFLNQSKPFVGVVRKSDGPIAEVSRNARFSAHQLLKEEVA